jgi:addiction module RelE/StbE family toxin
LVVKELAKIKQNDKKLSERIHKQLLLFSSNPKHPSLRVHKLTGSMNNIWSISVSMSIRMVYKLIDKETTYFIDIGTHEEVYKK